MSWHQKLHEAWVKRAKDGLPASNDAERYGVMNGDLMKLRVEGTSTAVFEDVICRVDPKVLLEVHLDTDEGNACDLANARHVELMRQ